MISSCAKGGLASRPEQSVSVQVINSLSSRRHVLGLRSDLAILGNRLEAVAMLTRPLAPINQFQLKPLTVPFCLRHALIPDALREASEGHLR